MRVCSIDECGEMYYAKSYCVTHYRRWRRWGDPHKVGETPYGDWSNANPERRRKRLLKKVEIDAATGCWTWTGSKTLQGYGQMRVDGKRLYTHRISYELHVGPIPEGLDLDHLCRNRACCNPAHLEPVTHLVNVRRGTGPVSRTHCPLEHPYSGDNLIKRKNGTRGCRACERLNNKKRWQQTVAARSPRQLEN